MRFSVSAAYLSMLVLLPLASYGKSIYIDPSCTDREGWEGYWNEGQSMAKRAVERMNSESDTDYNAVFKSIFQTAKDSDEGKYVKGILNRMSHLNRVWDVKKSEIRFFCDDDARWEKRKNGGWKDEINGMVSPREPTCLRKEGGMGVTYYGRAIVDGQNPDRLVVSICSFALNGFGRHPVRLTDDVKVTKLRGNTIWSLTYLVSMTIIHELAHAVSGVNGKDTVDIKDLPNGASAYGWQNVINKPAAMAIKNAENYAYLGLWAIVADAGFSLVRMNQKGLSVKEVAYHIINGYLYHYPDITRRSLTPVLFSA